MKKFIFLFSLLSSHLLVIAQKEIKQSTGTAAISIGVVGQDKKNNFGENIYVVTQINVYSTDNKKQIQSITGLTLPFSNGDKYSKLDRSKLLTIEDVNFDGDLDIWVKSNAYIKSDLIWLFNSQEQLFTRSPAFEKIATTLAIDKEREELRNSVMEGNFNVKSSFKVVNNKPVKVSGTVIQPPNGNCCGVYSYYVTGEHGSEQVTSYQPQTSDYSMPNNVLKLVRFKNADSVLHYYGSMTDIRKQSAVDEMGIPESYVYTVYTGSLLDANDRLFIAVSKTNKILKAWTDAPTSFWKFPYNLQIGVSIDALQKINGKPFTVNGFETDNGGLVNWNGGVLTGKKIMVELSYKGVLLPEFIGEGHVFNLSNPKLKTQSIYVKKIIIAP